MFTRLLTNGSDRPDALVAYAIGTLLRLQYYDRDEHYQRWAQWAGCDSVRVLRSNPPLLSTVTIIHDGIDAIVGFEGTIDPIQLFFEMVNSGPRMDNLTNANCHSFFLWSVQRRYSEIIGILNTLPEGARIHVCGHSLGGGMAHIVANRLRRNSRFRVTALTTFGQPRTFAIPTGIPEELSTYVRFAHAEDIVPTVPPSPYEWACVTVLAPLLFPVTRYVHTNEAWICREQGIWYQGDLRREASIQNQLVMSILNGEIRGERFMRTHIMRAYTRALTNEAVNGPGGELLLRMRQLNAEVDVLDGVDPDFRLPLQALPSPARFLHPRATFSDDGSPPVVPPEDIGKKIEVRGVSHALLSFGLGGSMAHKFTGRDRRILISLMKITDAVIQRDIRAADPKPTARLSNRQKMFPAGGDHPLDATIQAVYAQSVALLDKTV